VQRFRRFTSGMSRVNHRSFCARWVAEAAPRGTGTRRTRTYSLEPANFAAADPLRLNPRPHGNTQVCAKLFGFMLNRSVNYLYQPTRPGKPMVEVLAQTRFHASVKEDGIVLFILPDGARQ
jgi:hypothetical protein